jgi:hypothetical protein
VFFADEAFVERAQRDAGLICDVALPHVFVTAGFRQVDCHVDDFVSALLIHRTGTAANTIRGTETRSSGQGPGVFCVPFLLRSPALSRSPCARDRTRAAPNTLMRSRSS